MAFGSLPQFLFKREIGDCTSRPSTSQRHVIDHRIRSLELSWRHAIPFHPICEAGRSAMAFDNAERRFLLCGSAKGSVSIVDFESGVNSGGVETYPIQHPIIPSRDRFHHQFLINCCKWFPVDSSLFATGGMDHKIKLWDANSMKPIDVYRFETPISQFDWTVDCAATSNSLLVVGINSSNVTLIDPRMGTAIQQIRCKEGRVGAVRWLNSGNFFLATGDHQGELAIWDVRSGRSELARIKAFECKGAHSKQILYRIAGIRDTDDGRFIVALTNNGQIQVRDSGSLEEVVAVGFLPVTHSSQIGNFDLSDEGRLIRCFVPSTNNVAMLTFDPKCFKPARQSKKGHMKPPYTGQVTKRLESHYLNVVCCAYRTGYQQLVTSSMDRLTLIWAPKMDEFRPEADAVRIQQLHEDAYSDED